LRGKFDPMKKAILIVAVLLSALTVSSAHAAVIPFWTVLLVGGPGADSFRVTLHPDGETYEIESLAPLEVGGKVCSHPGGDPLKLVCEARPIAGFEVNAGGGDDTVEVDSMIHVPVTLSGGAGNDRLLGGSREDKLSGGDGFDRLFGGAGNDSVLGGSGADVLLGGNGDDELGGEGGQDNLVGGTGNDHLSGGLRHDNIFGSGGDDRLNGGEGRDLLSGGNGNDSFIGAHGDRVFGGLGDDVAIPGGVVE
jgi:Ca2+-binding RTX toxin-like protein